MEQLKKRLEDKIKLNRRSLEEFQDRLQEDPARAFEWGGYALEAAAQLEVYKIIHGMVMKGHGIDVIIKVAQDKVNLGALYPTHSTAPLSNLMSIYRTAAWASIVDQSVGMAIDI